MKVYMLIPGDVVRVKNSHVHRMERWEEYEGCLGLVVDHNSEGNSYTLMILEDDGEIGGGAWFSRKMLDLVEDHGVTESFKREIRIALEVEFKGASSRAQVEQR